MHVIQMFLLKNQEEIKIKRKGRRREGVRKLRLPCLLMSPLMLLYICWNKEKPCKQAKRRKLYNMLEILNHHKRFFFFF